MDASSFESAARLVGWVLLHSVWQGALLGVGYACLRPFFARGQARYRLGLSMLWLLLVCQVFTVVMLSHVSAAPQASQDALQASPAMVRLAATDATNLVTTHGLDHVLDWLAVLWTLGVAAHLLRAGREWRRLGHWVRHAEPAPFWQERVAAMARRFSLRRPVRLLCSTLVDGPLIVGLLKPVILLPAAVLCRLPVEQVELVLAHELAHLRRLDPWANIFQFVVETLYFHHPAIRWLSRELRNEREICCDALVLSTLDGSRRAYADTLAALADMQVAPGPLVLASTGGKLLERIQLIALPAPDRQRSFMPLTVWMGLLLALLLAREAWQHQQVDSVPVWPMMAPVVALDTQALSTPMHLLWQRPVLHAVFSALRVAQASDVAPVPDSAGGRDSILIDRPAFRMGPVALSDPTFPIVTALPSAPAWMGEAPAPGITTPVPLHRVAPVYPQLALTQRIQGHVVLEFALDAHGRVRDVRVTSSMPAGVFDHAAMQALGEWVFTAPGQAAPRRFTQAMDFVLPGATDQTSHAMRARVPCVIPTGTHVCRPV